MSRARNPITAYSLVIVLVTLLYPHPRAAAENLHVNGFEMYYEVIGRGEPLVRRHERIRSVRSGVRADGDVARQRDRDCR